MTETYESYMASLFADDVFAGYAQESGNNPFMGVDALLDELEKAAAATPVPTGLPLNDPAAPGIVPDGAPPTAVPMPAAVPASAPVIDPYAPPTSYRTGMDATAPAVPAAVPGMPGAPVVDPYPVAPPPAVAPVAPVVPADPTAPGYTPATGPLPPPAPATMPGMSSYRAGLLGDDLDPQVPQTIPTPAGDGGIGGTPMPAPAGVGISTPDGVVPIDEVEAQTNADAAPAVADIVAPSAEMWRGLNAELSLSMSNLTKLATMYRVLSNNAQTDTDGRVMRAVIAAMDPAQGLRQVPTMAGCVALDPAHTGALESADQTTFMSRLSDLWHSLKAAVFAKSPLSSLGTVSRTLPAMVGTNDTSLAACATRLAALFHKNALSDAMVAGFIFPSAYTVVKPAGISAILSCLVSLDADVNRAVAVALPSTLNDLAGYQEQLKSLFAKQISTLGIQTHDATLGVQPSSSDLFKKGELLTLESGKPLSAAGYTTMAGVLGLAREISAKAQMGVVCAKLCSFVDASITQITALKGTVGPDNKLQVDEHVSAASQAALFLATLVDSIARLSVDQYLCPWVAVMESVGTGCCAPSGVAPSAVAHESAGGMLGDYVYDATDGVSRTAAHLPQVLRWAGEHGLLSQYGQEEAAVPTGYTQKLTAQMLTPAGNALMHRCYHQAVTPSGVKWGVLERTLARGK